MRERGMQGVAHETICVSRRENGGSLEGKVQVREKGRKTCGHRRNHTTEGFLPELGARHPAYFHHEINGFL